MNISAKLCLSLLYISLVSGCANNKIANTEILSEQAKQQAITSTLNPQEAILKAAKAIEKSQEAQLHFFAPLHYSAAQEALSEAQDLLTSSKEPSLILEQTFKVDTLLIAAYKNKTSVLSTLNKSLEHKKILEDLGSPQVLPEAFQDTVDDLKDLIKEIEGGYIDKALKGQAELLAQMTEVEIATLKKQHLSPVESMIDKADSIDADEFAEKTFRQAESTLASANIYIEKNFRNREGVKQTGLDALNAASHAYFIAKEASELVELKRADAEKKALYFESLLERINKNVGIPNLNTLSLYDQSVKLASALEGAKSSHTGNGVSSNESGSNEGPVLFMPKETANIEARPMVEEVSVTVEEDIDLSQEQNMHLNNPPQDESTQETGEAAK